MGRAEEEDEGRLKTTIRPGAGGPLRVGRGAMKRSAASALVLFPVLFALQARRSTRGHTPGADGPGACRPKVAPGTVQPLCFAQTNPANGPGFRITIWARGYPPTSPGGRMAGKSKPGRGSGAACPAESGARRARAGCPASRSRLALGGCDRLSADTHCGLNVGMR